MSRKITSLGWSLAAILLAAVATATPAHAAGTPAGTVISNQATVSFTDVNGNPLSAVSNIVTTTVSQVAAVTVDPDNGPVTVAPSATHYFAHTVTNGGNGDDTINLTAASAGGWTVALYNDVNGNGTYESGTDTLLTDTNADGTPDSGLLAHDGAMHILVAVTVPAGTADGASDVTTVTGTSVFDNTKTDTATDTIDTTAPDVAVVKSVAPAGAQPPGTTLTYTVVVTNNGTGAANAVVLTDPIPANTTYQAGTITYNAAARTDGADADNADYNVTNAGQVTVTIGTLGSGASVTVTFQVKID
jgi:uncharacterized repeat protein (TIGR01451 family)